MDSILDLDSEDPGVQIPILIFTTYMTEHVTSVCLSFHIYNMRWPWPRKSLPLLNIRSYEPILMFWFGERQKHAKGVTFINFSHRLEPWIWGLRASPMVYMKSKVWRERQEDKEWLRYPILPPERSSLEWLGMGALKGGPLPHAI